MVAVGDASSGNEALVSSVTNLQSRVNSLEPYLFCRLAASLSKFLRERSTVRTGSACSTTTTKKTTDVSKSLAKLNDNNKQRKEDEEDLLVEDVSSLDAAAEQVIDNLSPSLRESPATTSSALNNDKTARQEVRRLLDLVLEKASTRISDFSAEQLRRVLLHVVILPFPADAFVDAADSEVSKRLMALDADAATSRFGSLQDLSQYAADAAVDIAAALSSFVANGDDTLKFLRKGGKDTEPGLEKFSELAAEANRAAASACEAAARLDRVKRGAHINGEEMLQQMEHGAAFELGRCQCLIERYRRISFTGDGFSRRSRYDDERRKTIGKRVCSRLFA